MTIENEREEAIGMAVGDIQSITGDHATLRRVRDGGCAYLSNHASKSAGLALMS